MADKSSLEQLDRRHSRARQLGSMEKLATRQSRGQRNAEERLRCRLIRSRSSVADSDTEAGAFLGGAD